jgi:hypothetical protein
VICSSALIAVPFGHNSTVRVDMYGHVMADKRHGVHVTARRSSAAADDS